MVASRAAQCISIFMGGPSHYQFIELCPDTLYPSSLTGDRTLQQWLRSIDASLAIRRSGGRACSAARRSGRPSPRPSRSRPIRRRRSERRRNVRSPDRSVSTVSTDPGEGREGRHPGRDEAVRRRHHRLRSQVRHAPIPGGKFHGQARPTSRAATTTKVRSTESRDRSVLDGEVRDDLRSVRHLQLPARHQEPQGEQQQAGRERQSGRRGDPSDQPYTDMTFGMGHDVYRRSA